MLEHVEVVLPSQKWGAIVARVASEFPSIFVSFASDMSAPPHVCASQWDRRDFDSWSFDCHVDDLASSAFTLRIADDRGERAQFPIEVLNRCQRLIDRRNQQSQSSQFERVLRSHRALHDLSRPLVRADYRHALDTWQWTTRSRIATESQRSTP